MPFAIPDYQSIRDDILRDIVNQQRSDGQQPNVSTDGDYYIRANANGSAIEGLYQHQKWILRQIFPSDADEDYKIRHANLRGLTQKSATAATGSITFSGTVGSPVPIGTEAKTSSGIAYVTTASDLIGAGGTVSIAAQASSTGISGNQAATTALTLTAAPSGVVSTATIVSMTGGTDIETIDSLVSRLLFVLRNPPCGGAAHDYYTWAMNVDGVTAAYVYPNRRGLGTVDVLVLTEGGIPDAGLVANVQAYIDTQRPVQGDCLVLAPVAVTVNIAGTLTRAAGYSLATVSASINTAAAAYFATLKPGDTAYLKRIDAIISDTAGVVDFVLSAPTTNTATLVDSSHVQMPMLGTVLFT